MLGAEGIVSAEAQQYIGEYPATISVLNNGVRSLTWGIIEPKDSQYHTYRWLSSSEKNSIDSIREGDMESIQSILSNYI